MKPQPGTLHLINSEVRLATEPKPDINNPKFWEHVGLSDTWLNDSKYRKALKSWEESTLKVVNVIEGFENGKFVGWRLSIEYDPIEIPRLERIDFPQSCLFIPEDDNARVTEFDKH